MVDVLAELRAELRALRADIAEIRAHLPPVGARALTVAHVARRLNCSTRQVFNFLNAKKLTRGARTGRSTTVTVASLEAFEAGGAPLATPARPRPPASLPERFDADTEIAALKAMRAARKRRLP